MIAYILNFLLFFFLIILQVSFLALLNFPGNQLNLVLPLLLFFIIIIDYSQGLFWALWAGFFLDLFSAFNFGIISLSLLLTLILINFLFDNFFTNRSFWTLLLLGSLGLIIYQIFLGLLINFLFYFGLAELKIIFQLTALLWRFIFNLIILSLLFLAFNYFSQRLKSSFLLRERRAR